MKFTVGVKALSLAIAGVVVAAKQGAVVLRGTSTSADAGAAPPRSLQQQGDEEEEVEGTYLMAEVQYEDGHDEQRHAVALSNGQILEIEIENDAECEVSPGWERAYRSGESSIKIKGKKMKNGKIRAKSMAEGKKDKKKDKGEKDNKGNGPSGNDKKGKGPFDRRKLQTAGTKTVLVLRADAPDAATGYSEAQLSDDIFGTGVDKVNLRSQYLACSHGQLDFEPVNGNSTKGTFISDGVYSVNIPNNVSGTGDGTIRNAMTNAGNAALGDMRSQFDYVMVCIPPGTSGGWIGYAYVNSWLSVYNNKWCTYTSIQMHEIGHNLGLAHAGEGTGVYADQSGFMGYSYSRDDDKMCFNGVKNWQLGWFSDREVDLPISEAWAGNLYGPTKYSDTTSNDTMIVRIYDATCSSCDIYVSFNHKDSTINSGTREGQNQVLVHSKSGAPGAYAPSLLLAKLSAGQQYTASVKGKKKIIKVDSIDTTSGYASITMGCLGDTDCDDGSLCTENRCNTTTGECLAPIELTPSCASDGLFCTGSVCDPATGGCPDPCDDGDQCTASTCNEVDNTCQNDPIAGCKVYLACGSTAGTCKEQPPQLVSKNEEHEVRCCSDISQPNWNTYGTCLGNLGGRQVWGESIFTVEPHTGCYDAETYASSEEICATNGGRLCTRAELLADCTRGSGCSHDHDMIWSSDGEAPPLTEGPTGNPTTDAPSTSPTSLPSVSPSSLPSSSPTGTPVTSSPVSSQTSAPTGAPVTSLPSSSPSSLPTSGPTGAPATSSPSNSPSDEPTGSPSKGPTDEPSGSPSNAPSSPSPSSSPSQCSSPTDCIDGVYCNGVEMCENGACVPGTPVNCADSVDCTIDSCNETTKLCENVPSHELCADDELFCTGIETCDMSNGCQSSGDPCSGGETCAEDNNGICVTAEPTDVPSSVPSLRPTGAPVTSSPTSLPSASPSSGPTASPTGAPTEVPSLRPTSSPTSLPSASSSSVPTSSPTASPSSSPSSAPSGAPVTSTPSSLPTSSPTGAPVTFLPSSVPSSSPSRAPITSSPTDGPATAAPTPAAPDSFYVVCGASDKACKGQQVEAQVGELHEVRCCSDMPLSGWAKYFGCNVWGESYLGGDRNGGCYDDQNHTSAFNICEDNGGRLCTADELLRDCTRGSGCSHDWDLIWSSTKVAPTAAPTSQPTPEPSSASPTASMMPTRIGATGETGRVSISHDGATVRTRYTYVKPVVVAFINTRNGDESVDVRVADVDKNSFRIFLEKAPHTSGSSHPEEEVSYIVMEDGRHELEGGLIVEAGLRTTATVHRGGEQFSFPDDTINFLTAFTAIPAVLTTLNTYNNAAFMSSLATAVSLDKFQISQEALQTDSSSAEEDIAWMAFSMGSGTTSGGSPFIAQYDDTDGVNNGVGQAPYSIDLGGLNFTELPDLVVGLYETTGTDGAYARGAGAFDDTIQTVYAEEDATQDAERNHISVPVVWVGFGHNSDLFSAAPAAAAALACKQADEGCTSSDECCSGKCDGSWICAGF